MTNGRPDACAGEKTNPNDASTPIIRPQRLFIDLSLLV
jgi:hypothetical protein